MKREAKIDPKIIRAMKNFDEITYVGKDRTYVIKRIKCGLVSKWCLTSANCNGPYILQFDNWDGVLIYVSQMENFQQNKKIETYEDNFTVVEDFAYHMYGMALIGQIYNRTIIDSLQNAISIRFYDNLIVHEDNCYTVYYMNYVGIHEKQRELPSLEAALAYMVINHENRYGKDSDFARLNILLNCSAIVRTVEETT